MLGAWAGQKQTGQPMTKAQNLDIFGGPHGQNRAKLSKFIDELERREAEAEAADAPRGGSNPSTGLSS
jgi:hypothetical protein